MTNLQGDGSNVYERMHDVPRARLNLFFFEERKLTETLARKRLIVYQSPLGNSVAG